MLSYVPAGVPLYTEFSNFSREWGTARPDLRTTPQAPPLAANEAEGEPKEKKPEFLGHIRN